MSDAPIVYLNGQMVLAEEACLKIHDLGVVLGATVSEVARTFGRRLFRLEAHLRRLARSLECVRFEIGTSIERLGVIAEEVVEHNAQLVGPDGELELVIFITAGESPTYAAGADVKVRSEPTVCIHTFSLPFHVWAARMRAGARVVTPSVRHVPPECIPSCMKHRSRMHYYLAEQEARAIDPEAIPLLIDLRGNVAETSTANFLIVEHGSIVSPPLKNSLPGISRGMLIELAAKLGIAFCERDFDVSAIEWADEGLLASTPYCVMPAVQINGRPIGNGRPGPIFRQLIDAWSEAVGLDVYRQIVEVGEAGE